jgi:mono/diheme cytochrome c family protein
VIRRSHASWVVPTIAPFVAIMLIRSTSSKLQAAGALLQADTQKSMWVGVFTESQAIRGQSIYRDECARCHSDTLAGGESSPPLVGDAFLDEWNGKTVADLFERMRATMPEDSPGRLSGKQYASLIAYILQVNSVPAGANELDAALPLLKTIKIDKTKPSRIE